MAGGAAVCAEGFSPVPNLICAKAAATPGRGLAVPARGPTSILQERGIFPTGLRGRLRGHGRRRSGLRRRLLAGPELDLRESGGHAGARIGGARARTDVNPPRTRHLPDWPARAAEGAWPEAQRSAPKASRRS